MWITDEFPSKWCLPICLLCNIQTRFLSFDDFVVEDVDHPPGKSELVGTRPTISYRSTCPPLLRSPLVWGEPIFLQWIPLLDHWKRHKRLLLKLYSLIIDNTKEQAPWSQVLKVKYNGNEEEEEKQNGVVSLVTWCGMCQGRKVPRAQVLL